ncbi:MAG: carboxypeptidase-like regulatory domain-containing protein [Saprospiraceae bacterium]|nr:carboxypeptidase-like regulatory domain-containing protein [Saprospiraceae bacterium]
MIFRLVLTVFGIFFFSAGIAQIYGTVRDEQSIPIPHVNIYIQGSNISTSTNQDGEYELNTGIGVFDVYYQQIGFEKLKIKINVVAERTEANVTLKAIKYELDEVEFVVDREDPAYSIIRKSIQKRFEYRIHKGIIRCNAYSKGMLKLTNVPEKVLGNKVGDFDGELDSTRKGMLYLSESFSDLYFFNGKLAKETMLSSKVAGNDRGFSFNRAGTLQFNLYDNSSDFGRAIISPIADFALSHYKYRLLGSNINSDGLLIHKIELLPKVQNDAVWNGYLYIQDSTWSIYEFDGYILGKQIKQEIFDTIYLTQQHFFDPGKGNYFLRFQNFNFTAGLLGFKVNGNFLINYSEYQYENSIPSNSSHEVLEILSNSNKKSNQYWDSIRPIPLTSEEDASYRKKDSIRVYKESRVYMDSMDLKRNRFKYSHLLLGYRYSNSFKRRFFGFESLLNSIQFNTLQGWTLGTKLAFEFYPDSLYRRKSYESLVKLNYGFSDNSWQYVITQNKYFGDYKNTLFSVSLGRTLREFISSTTTNRFYNQFSSLFLKYNPLKLYQNEFVKINFNKDLNYDISLKIESSYSKRSEISNSTEYSWRLKKQSYTANNSTTFRDSFLLVSQRYLFQSKLQVEYQPLTKVWKTPNDIQKLGSDWPLFRWQQIFNYYDKLHKLNSISSLGLEYYLDLNRWGSLQVAIDLKKSFGVNPDIPEAIHIPGNPTNVYDLVSSLNYKVIEPYRMIGLNKSISFHLEQNFHGLLLDRVYLVSKLGLKEIFGISLLSIDNNKLYQEYSIGLGNVGYGLFRYLRMDWVKTRWGNEWGNSYLRVGINNIFSIGK